MGKAAKAHRKRVQARNRKIEALGNRFRNEARKHNAMLQDMQSFEALNQPTEGFTPLFGSDTRIDKEVDII